MERFFMEEKSKGKKILEILQENYEIESAQDLSSAIKDLFKDSLQEMMNAEFETSMGYQKYDNKTEKSNIQNYLKMRELNTTKSKLGMTERQKTILILSQMITKEFLFVRLLLNLKIWTFGLIRMINLNIK